MSKLVVIVQCELVTRRCSGYNCMKAFTQRSGKMEGYPEDTRYMVVNCGGCCGAGIDVKIENLEKRLLANEEKKEDVVIHQSCFPGRKNGVQKIARCKRLRVIVLKFLKPFRIRVEKLTPEQVFSLPLEYLLSVDIISNYDSLFNNIFSLSRLPT